MNLHFIIDNTYSRKFLDFTNKNFDTKNNKFILITYQEIKYIDVTKYDNLQVIFYKKEMLFQYTREFKYILNEMGKYKKIFVHYLTDLVVSIILAYKKPVEYNWMLWGADFYCISDIKLMQMHSRELVQSRKIISINRLKDWIKLYRRKEAIKKINYVLTWNKGDFQIIKNSVKTSAEMRYCFYPSPVDYESLSQINDKAELKAELKHEYDYVIQVGNSGDPTNNHIEILIQLKRIINNENIAVLCPLSYGDKFYINKLILKGKELLGDRFIPLTEYLSPNEYKDILSQIDIAIMNHNRQQGVGNIWALLYLKKKVYINGYVTTYNTFKEHGLAIYDTVDLKNIGLEELLSMDKHAYLLNREIVFNTYNDDAAYNCLNNIIAD